MSKQQGNETPQWRQANKRFDRIMQSFIGLSVGITMVIVLGIVLFIFIKGAGGLSLQFFTNDYDDKTVYAGINYSQGAHHIELEERNGDYVVTAISGAAYKNASDAAGAKTSLGKGDIVYSIDKKNLPKNDAEGAMRQLNDLSGEHVVKVKVVGGGIRPMLFATVYIILLTLLFSVPIGVFAAVYLNEYAREGRFLALIRFAIESLAGIPSIIYGLFGMLLFVTMLHFNYSILAGALTVAIILLPTIISTTEEALKAVPRGLREGSLALGATQFQTVRKVVLPNAIPGILTTIVLSIGRIIGESAALFLTAGTVARVPGSFFESAATLTVKAYTVTKEEGNIEMACAIGIVIIVIVLILNALTRGLQRFNRIK